MTNTEKLKKLSDKLFDFIEKSSEDKENYLNLSSARFGGGGDVSMYGGAASICKGSFNDIMNSEMICTFYIAGNKLFVFFNICHEGRTAIIPLEFFTDEQIDWFKNKLQEAYDNAYEFLLRETVDHIEYYCK